MRPKAITRVDAMPVPAATPVRFGTKLAATAGFGGVLLMMAVAGADSIRVLRRIEDNHRQITQNYLETHHTLEQLRSSLWRSGSVVRDYLLHPDPAAAADLTLLRSLRQEMEADIRRYGAGVPRGQQGEYDTLKVQLAAYWRDLEPVFRWTPAERRKQGYAFLTDEVLPRRATILEAADRIDALNGQALKNDDRYSAELFANFRRRTIAMLVVSLAVGLAVAAVSVSQILRLEREAMARYHEIVRARGELERLSARLVQAQEEERRAISRELHDQVGQSLSALLVDLGNLAAVTPRSGDGEAGRLLDTARKLAEESVHAVRNMALLLRPSMLDDFGLVPALNWHVREVARRTGLRVSVSADGVSDELPDRHNTCVYRIVQEALHNCARHAEAKTVRIVLTQEGNTLRLTVQDDGKGFDPQTTRGLGLLGMEERVKHLGGLFAVESRPGKGTLIRVELPLAPEEALAGVRG